MWYRDGMTLNLSHARNLVFSAVVLALPFIMAACEADKGPYPFGW